MPSASFCLLCLCIAENVQNSKCSENSQKITEIPSRQKTPASRRTSPGGAHSPQEASRSGPRSTARGPHLVDSSTASRRLFAYIFSPNLKTSEHRRFLQKHIRVPPPPKTLIRGTELPDPAPCRDWELPPEPSSSPLLPPMMRRE